MNTGIGDMERYAIIKDGKDFIVQAEARSILKCTSRREAIRAVADAKGLMRADGNPDADQAEKPLRTKAAS